jgi:ribosomal protein S18 acetylase RimI-like enzyme
MSFGTIGGVRECLFGMDDYDAALALWKRCPGVGLSSADEPGPMGAFLVANPGLSFAAWEGERLVGTSLCGSDGRRGYLYHVAVDPEYRRRGIGSLLASASLAALATTGIKKCHLFVLADNESGAAFWRVAGWTPRGDIAVFSKSV